MARKPPSPQSGHTILLVDDQEEVLISVRILLEREGHHVLAAQTGERALELFKEHDIHLLLVNYFMPQMSGEQLIRKIRNIDPYVQIILQTGYAGLKPPRTMLHELDIQGYHDKTEGPEKLLLWVRAGLKAYRSISQLRERERQRGEMVANISHELRNPLGIIVGYSEMLLEGVFGELPADARRPLRALAGTTYDLSELVGNFLLYAKTEARAMSVNRQPMPLDELVRELRSLGDLLFTDSEVSFAVELDGAPPAIRTDAVKLRTILRNLVRNAAKFTPRGTVSVHVTQESGTLRCAVCDTGIGIPAAEQEAIFEPFRQIDGSMTREHRGVGLGLALSRALARLLGGDLEVESEPGVGSVFTLLLPLEDAVENRAASSPPLPVAPTAYSMLAA